jgi:hypothetical protein
LLLRLNNNKLSSKISELSLRMERLEDFVQTITPDNLSAISKKQNVQEENTNSNVKPHPRLPHQAESTIISDSFVIIAQKTPHKQLLEEGNDPIKFSDIKSIVTTLQVHQNTGEKVQKSESSYELINVLKRSKRWEISDMNKSFLNFKSVPKTNKFIQDTATYTQRAAPSSLSINKTLTAISNSDKFPKTKAILNISEIPQLTFKKLPQIQLKAYQFENSQNYKYLYPHKGDEDDLSGLYLSHKLQNNIFNPDPMRVNKSVLEMTDLMTIIRKPKRLHDFPFGELPTYCTRQSTNLSTIPNRKAINSSNLDLSESLILLHHESTAFKKEPRQFLEYDSYSVQQDHKMAKPLLQKSNLKVSVAKSINYFFNKSSSIDKILSIKDNILSVKAPKRQDLSIEAMENFVNQFKTKPLYLLSDQFAIFSQFNKRKEPAELLKHPNDTTDFFLFENRHVDNEPNLTNISLPQKNLIPSIDISSSVNIFNKYSRAVNEIKTAKDITTFPYFFLSKTDHNRHQYETSQPVIYFQMFSDKIEIQEEKVPTKPNRSSFNLTTPFVILRNEAGSRSGTQFKHEIQSVGVIYDNPKQKKDAEIVNNEVTNIENLTKSEESQENASIRDEIEDLKKQMADLTDDSNLYRERNNQLRKENMELKKNARQSSDYEQQINDLKQSLELNDKELEVINQKYSFLYNQIYDQNLFEIIDSVNNLK